MDCDFLRKIENKTRMDRIMNEIFRQELGIKSIQDKIVEGQLKWYGHVCRMPQERIARRI